MEKFNKHIADIPNVEFIHVSLDSEKGAAEKWAAEETFPWLTILPEDVEASGLREAYKTTDAVPEYHLIDANGKTIVAGTHEGTAAFEKIDELAAKKSD